jgi:hypothetical protein
VELNTGDLQGAYRGACVPLSISHPEMSKASRRLVPARAGRDARRSHRAARSRAAFAAHACSLLSNSVTLVWTQPISMARTAAIKSMTSVASRGDRMPPAQAPRIARAASTRSPASAISGRSKATGRSRRGGNSRPTQKRSVAPSPAKALSMSLPVSASAAPSSRASTAMVVLLRAPFGRPLGLPPEGGANGVSQPLGMAPAAGLRSSMLVSSSRLAALPGAGARAMR